MSEEAARWRLGGAEEGDADPALRLWEVCSLNARSSPPGPVAGLLGALGLGHSLPPDRARDTLSSLYGWCCRSDACRALRGATGKSYVFQGKGWGHAVCVPYFSGPGLVRGYAVAGRDGDEPGEVRYWRKPGKDPDFGLAGLGSLASARDVFGATVFAVSDPVLMLRLQTRHLATALRPLPLVAWHDGPEGATTSSWSAVAGRKVVFLSFGLDPATLRQAVLTGGRVYLCAREPLPGEALDRFLDRHNPADLVAAAHRGARGWRSTLDCLSKAVGPRKVDGVAAAAQSSDAHRVLAAASPHDVSYLSRRAPGPVRSSVRWGASCTVTEHPDGSWTAQRDGGPSVLVSSAALRVTEVFRDDRGLCAGYVRYKGEDVPFAAQTSVLEADPFRFMDRLLISSGKGVLSWLPSWKKRILPLARLFHEPALVESQPPGKYFP